MIRMKQSKGFKNIVFGRAAAENEKTPGYRKLLLEGFLDTYNYTNQLLYDEKFLVLGLKGSGKSAIGVRLELLSQEKSDLKVKNYSISGNFPHRMFSQLMDSNESQLIRFQYYWEYLILMVFLESFSEDDSAIYKDADIYKELISSMKALELIPCRSFADLVTRTKGDHFKANLFKVLEGENYSDGKELKKGLPYIFDLLKEVTYSVSVKIKHILVIDGLDDLLTQQLMQYNIVSALIDVADRINRRFLDNNVNAKIILLCRTDLFEILPGSNLNKIKHDSGIILNWYEEGVPLSSSNLVHLINLRAKVSLGYDVDVFEELLPRTILTGSLTTKTLLDNTRYRPRDFIQLFNYIQNSTNGNEPTNPEIWSGIKQYSINHLLDEIKNDLHGFLNNDEREKAIKILALMNKPSFTIQELEEKKNLDARFRSLELVKVLQALFDCGAISNYRKDDTGRDIITTKYRSPTAYFDPTEGIKIHWGLWKAFNIIDPYEEDM